ncbi:MAG: phosphoribosyl-AMP cyclohydrolase [Myxococcota bacterium]|nr:phosphoribosyl-AMP cyclohydrolase [Myxococcota bacterium]
MSMLEEGSDLTLDFGKLRSVAESDHDVIPVVIQDADSERVLFVGYANQQALSETLLRREAVLWSTSRNELWHKGATSGDVLKLEEVRVNCEQNSLLYRVRPARGGACHTRDSDGNTRPGCYYRRLANREALEFV